jgi:hypothetical protein
MDEDMILPDDFVDTPAAEEPADTQESATEDFDTETIGEDTKPPSDNVESTQESEKPQKLKVKFNHEERELDFEEAAQLAQKGMNYEKAVERARQEAAQQARDSVIAEMGYTWNGQPITTEAQYKQAMAEQKLIEQYRDRDLPPEVIQELVENRRDREERQREKQTQAEQAKQQEAFNEFFQYFEQVNDRRFDANKDILPQEVIDAVAKGQPLKFAYMEHHNKTLRDQLKIAKQNQSNSKKAPVGSVTAGGGVKTDPEDLFLQGFNSI